MPNSENEDDELGPIGGLVVGGILVVAGLFLTSATNYVLAIGPINTGIGLPIVGWAFVLFGGLGLLGSGMEFKEKYLGRSDTVPDGNRQRRSQGDHAQHVQRPQQGQPQHQRRQGQSQQQPHGRPDQAGPRQPAHSQQNQSPQQQSPQQQSRQREGTDRGRSQTRNQKPARQEQPSQPPQTEQSRQAQQCPSCEQRVPSGHNYCQSCGAELN